MFSSLLSPLGLFGLLFLVLSWSIALFAGHENTFLDVTKRVGLVIAHPDDEAMFFVPTLLSLRERGIVVAVLCLSSGNADGLGATRSIELRESAMLLGIQRGRVSLVDSVHLDDGLDRSWPSARVETEVERFAREQGIDTIVTFDEGGVSGHPNHIDTFRGVRSFLSRSSAVVPPVVGYSLLSTPIWRKYAGIFDGGLSWIESLWSRPAAPGSGSGSASNRVHFVTSCRPQMSYTCMAAHATQFVWYRRMFVVFSRYTFINTLRRIDVD